MFLRLITISFILLSSAFADWNPYYILSSARDHNEIRFSQSFPEQPDYDWRGDYSILGPSVDFGMGVIKSIAPHWDLSFETSIGYSVAQSSVGISAITGVSGQASMDRDWMFSARVMPVYKKYGEIGAVLGLELMNYNMSSDIASFASVGSDTSQIAGGLLTGITTQSAVNENWAVRLSWLETLFLQYEYDVILPYSNTYDDSGTTTTVTANIQHVSFKPTIDRFMASIIYYPRGQDLSRVITPKVEQAKNYVLFNFVKDVSEMNESQDQEQILKVFHLPLAVSGWGGEITAGRRFNVNDSFFFGIEGFAHFLNSFEENQGLHTQTRFEEQLEHNWDVGFVLTPGVTIGEGQNLVLLAGIARGDFTDRGIAGGQENTAIDLKSWGGVAGVRQEITLDDHWRLALGMKTIHFQSIQVQTSGTYSLNDFDDISSGIYSAGLMYTW